VKNWIENRRVLAAFSDPAGAKAVLAFLWLHRQSGYMVTAVSDRVHSFYRDFGIPVRDFSERDAAAWLEGVDVVVTGTSVPHRIEVELIELAAQGGIPTHTFIDHWTNLRARFGPTCMPDTIAVIDERARALAVADGLPEASLRVTGNPYHDFLRTWVPKLGRAELAASLGLAQGVPILIYAPEPLARFGLKSVYGFDEIDGLRAVRAALAAHGLGRFSLIIKAHPNQEHALFESELAARPDPRITYLRDGDLPTLCFHSAAVLGFFSNSLLEARLLARPVVRVLVGLAEGAADVLTPFEAPDFRAAYDHASLVRMLRDVLHLPESGIIPS
jgi:hypothetical protein